MSFADIESSYNPKAKTGKYKCLFQLSDSEFAKYWRGDIYDIRATARLPRPESLRLRAAEFEKDIGRKATAAELYCIHQQGYQGCAFHITPRHSSWHGRTCT